MKNGFLLFLVAFAFSGCGTRPETHLGKLDWEKQLAEAQKNNDYGSCQVVVVAAYLDKNQPVLDMAAEVCFPLAKTYPV